MKNGTCGKKNGVLKHSLGAMWSKSRCGYSQFKSNFDFVLNKEYIDPGGRFIIFDIKAGNLYASR